ncbi:hypothetical protein, partial [Aeromonas veronii]|uniref:hypothetical protein n=1 Tax=Aeromonas veronii TaxID=654 RepID=UPI001A907DAF
MSVVPDAWQGLDCLKKQHDAANDRTICPINLRINFFLDIYLQSVRWRLLLATSDAGWSSPVARRAHNPKVV